jgi:hypothetical protein
MKKAKKYCLYVKLPAVISGEALVKFTPHVNKLKSKLRQLMPAGIKRRSVNNTTI